MDRMRRMIRTARAWERTLFMGDCMILLAARRWPTGEVMTEDDALLMARILGRHARFTRADIANLWR